MEPQPSKPSGTSSGEPFTNSEYQQMLVSRFQFQPGYAYRVCPAALVGTIVGQASQHQQPQDIQGGALPAAQPQQAIAPRRQRATKACDTCRIKKATCGDTQPCGRFRRMGIECTYTGPSRRRGPPRAEYGRPAERALGILSVSNPDLLQKIVDELRLGGQFTKKGNWVSNQEALADETQQEKLADLYRAGLIAQLAAGGVEPDTPVDSVESPDDED
ncbi:hypothetical protein F4778DRAFT_747417 [Xylariomycetidae sp. FL2044]|nr:hypothetical protein F4778DRAFT_747417 [Xylariomycetidae sp. FL2044]